MMYMEPNMEIIEIAEENIIYTSDNGLNTHPEGDGFGGSHPGLS